MASTIQTDPFAELLCSKLCHDLISPIGAITNGLELIAEEDASTTKDAIALIGLSARQAASRLTLFRLAFGTWGTDAGSTFGVLRKSVADYAEDRKCPISWGDPAPADSSPIDRTLGKLLVNLMLIAADCAQRNAAIAVSLTMEGAAQITVEGERCKLRDDVRTGFESGLAYEKLTVRNVVAQHCQRLADKLQVKLAIAEAGASSVKFTVA